MTGNASWPNGPTDHRFEFNAHHFIPFLFIVFLPFICRFDFGYDARNQGVPAKARSSNAGVMAQLMLTGTVI
jgi:hypothetical protein